MINAPALEIAVLIIGMIVLMLEAFLSPSNKQIVCFGAIAALAVVFGATFFVSPQETHAGAFWQFYAADTLAMFFKRFALATTILVLIMTRDFLAVTQSAGTGSKREPVDEFYALPIFTCAGLMYMVSAIDFIMIFVSLELVTISFYVLVSFTRRNPLTLEAGVKYLVLSALSTGFLLYGITWMFGATGETNLERIATAFSGQKFDQSAALLGMALIIVGLGFKIAAVPFQIWVPDVYQGAPTPVTAFLSVGSKAAGFVVLLRVLQPFMMLPHVERLIVGIALLTLLYGNLAALPQKNLKRLLGYSSIAHAGYLLIGIACLDGRAVAFYLVGYLLMTMLSFMVLIAVAEQTGGEIADFAGLSRRAPFLAFAMLIAMASLAGIPFTVGFFGKFFIFVAAVAHHQIALVTVGAFTVACGFYYYLKVVRAMYWEEARTTTPIVVSGLSRVTMAVLIIAIVGLGFFPQLILRPFEKQSAAVTQK
jgi:NADH-quinone oxidoreductase subunit N